MKKNLHDIIKERILILDGAMGTMIQTYGLTEEDFRGKTFNVQRSMFNVQRSMFNVQRSTFNVQMKGNNDMLCLTRPDVVTDIHRRYLRAGADIIETNTFSSQRISQADYHLQNHAREMALQGARLARQCADEFSSPEKPRFVAGSVGPTNKTCSMSPDVSNPARRDLTYSQLFEAYLEQMDALIEGGVDALLIETIFDSLNSKCAIDAAMTAMQQRGVTLPIMLSVTVSDLAGRTLSGQTLEAYLASVSTYPIFSIGLNCSFGARQMKPFLKELAQRAPYYISCYPNAGLPNSLGLYDETAEWSCSRPTPSPSLLREGSRYFQDNNPPPSTGRGQGWVSLSTSANAATWLARASSSDSSRRRTTTRPSPLPASKCRTARWSSTSTWTTVCSMPVRRW